MLALVHAVMLLAQTEPVTTTFTLNASLVLIASSFVIPVLTALVTRFGANAFVKQVVTVALAAAITLFNQGIINTGQAIISKQSVLLWVTQAASAALIYVVAYKPHNLAAQPIMAPNRGLALGTNTSVQPVTH